MTKQIQELNQRNATLEELTDKWHKKYNSLLKDHYQLKDQYSCKSCLESIRQLEKGEFIFCKSCKDRRKNWIKEIEHLRQELNYWKDSYQSLLDEKHDERNGDGSERRFRNSSRDSH